MTLLKNIISINAAILIFAIAIIPFSIRQIIETFDSFDRLNHFTGVIQEKKIIEDSSKKKHVMRICKLKLMNNSTEFIVSKYVDRVDNLLEFNDSVHIYTKTITSKYGNFVTDEKGNLWNSKSQNEVFHLTSNRFEDPIIDFYEHKRNLIKTVWVFPFMSLLFFAWYFYRRSGYKSPLIVES